MAEVDSLLLKAKMAMTISVKCVFTIFATNASFWGVIAYLPIQYNMQYSVFVQLLPPCTLYTLLTFLKLLTLLPPLTLLKLFTLLAMLTLLTLLALLAYNA